MNRFNNHMSNHRARTWDHRGSKPLSPKLLPLGHHLDGSLSVFLFSLLLVLSASSSSKFFLLFPPPPRDLSFSGFYSQRTMLFLPAINCRCNGSGGRPLKKMNIAWQNGVVLVLMVICVLALEVLKVL